MNTRSPYIAHLHLKAGARNKTAPTVAYTRQPEADLTWLGYCICAVAAGSWIWAAVEAVKVALS